MENLTEALPRTLTDTNRERCRNINPSGKSHKLSCCCWAMDETLILRCRVLAACLEWKQFEPRPRDLVHKGFTSPFGKFWVLILKQKHVLFQDYGLS
jgi:hypothetical protein